MKKQILISCVLSCVSWNTAVLADVALTYTNPNNQSGDMVLTVSGGRAAMLMPGEGGESSRMIYDKNEDKLYMVMDSQQQYIDMDTMMQSLGGISDMLAGAMENMPEDSKAQLGDLLGGMLGNNKPAEPAQPPTITRTGESGSVAGIDCDMIRMEAAGETTEMCLAEPDDAGVSNKDFAILQSMMEKQAKSAKQAGEMLGVSGLEFSPGKLDGVPLRIEQKTGSDAGSRSELKSTSDSIDASVVEIPANYTPATMLGS